MRKFYEADASEEQQKDRIRGSFTLKEQTGRELVKAVTELKFDNTYVVDSCEALTFRSRVALPDHEHTWKSHRLELVSARSKADDALSVHVLFDGKFFCKFGEEGRQIIDSEVHARVIASAS